LLEYNLGVIHGVVMLTFRTKCLYYLFYQTLIVVNTNSKYKFTIFYKNRGVEL